jgi:hypothetical protein
MYVPDNESIYEAHEREQERFDRISKREEIEGEIDPRDLPFYYDSIGIRETFGKGINDGRIKNCN